MGKANVIQEGEEICFWALGSFLETAENFEHNHSKNAVLLQLWNSPGVCETVGYKTSARAIPDHRIIITMEDNVLAGGTGSAVLEFLESQSAQVTVKKG